MSCRVKDKWLACESFWNAISDDERDTLFRGLRLRELGELQVLPCGRVVTSRVYRLVKEVMILFSKRKRDIRLLVTETEYFQDLKSRGSEKSVWNDVWEFYRFYQAFVDGSVILRPPIVFLDTNYLFRVTGKHRTCLHYFLNKESMIDCWVCTLDDILEWRKLKKKEEQHAS